MTFYQIDVLASLLIACLAVLLSLGKKRELCALNAAGKATADRRFYAGLLDVLYGVGVLLTAGFMELIILMVIYQNKFYTIEDRNYNAVQAIGFCLVRLILPAAVISFQEFRFGFSYGKKKAKLRIVRRDGTCPNYWHLYYRNLVGIVFLPIMVLGLLPIFWEVSDRSLLDWVTFTRVNVVKEYLVD